MKVKITVVCIFVFSCFYFGVKSNLQTINAQNRSDNEFPEIIVMGEQAMLGKITFNHAKHAIQGPGGLAPIACVFCHHVEQPLSEAVKNPFHKTVYPADRTVTLTAETFKDSNTPKVIGCRNCHIRRDATPTILKEIPQITDGDKTTVLTNHNAFHRRCAGCHDQVLKENPASNAPKSTQCTSCHKKS